MRQYVLLLKEHMYADFVIQKNWDTQMSLLASQNDIGSGENSLLFLQYVENEDIPWPLIYTP